MAYIWMVTWGEDHLPKGLQSIPTLFSLIFEVVDLKSGIGFNN